MLEHARLAIPSLKPQLEQDFLHNPVTPNIDVRCISQKHFTARWCICQMSVCQNFLFMADHGCFGGVLSLYKDSVTCFCEVSLCSRESKKTIRLTDPTRSLPCPLLPSAALYCSLLPFTVLYLPFTALHCLFLPFTCPLRPFTALYCPSLPFTALYCMGQWLIKRSGRYRLGYRLGID